MAAGTLFRSQFGEFILSQKGIDPGKAYMQEQLNKKGGVSSYLKSF